MPSAARGHRPWLRGLLWVRGADYWTFKGLNVEWPNTMTFNHENHDSMLVKFIDGVGWEFRNVEIRGARGHPDFYVRDGKRPSPANWRLTNNSIHSTDGSWTHPMGQDHNVYIAHGPGQPRWRDREQHHLRRAARLQRQSRVGDQRTTGRSI